MKGRWFCQVPVRVGSEVDGDDEDLDELLDAAGSTSEEPAAKKLRIRGLLAEQLARKRPMRVGGSDADDAIFTASAPVQCS